MHDEAAIGGGRSRVIDQPRLADARGPGDEDRARTSGRCRTEASADPVSLVPASDDLRHDGRRVSSVARARHAHRQDGLAFRWRYLLAVGLEGRAPRVASQLDQRVQRGLGERPPELAVARLWEEDIVAVADRDARVGAPRPDDAERPAQVTAASSGVCQLSA
jgi:hypothetical protein